MKNYRFLLALLLMQSYSLFGMDWKYQPLHDGREETENTAIQSGRSYQTGQGYQVPFTSFDKESPSYASQFIDKEQSEKELTALRKQLEQKQQELKELPDYELELRELTNTRKMQYHLTCAWLTMAQFPYYFARLFIDMSDPTTNRDFTNKNWPGWANLISDPLEVMGAGAIVPIYHIIQREKAEKEQV